MILQGKARGERWYVDWVKSFYYMYHIHSTDRMIHVSVRKQSTLTSNAFYLDLKQAALSGRTPKITYTPSFVWTLRIVLLCSTILLRLRAGTVVKNEICRPKSRAMSIIMPLYIHAEKGSIKGVG